MLELLPCTSHKQPGKSSEQWAHTFPLRPLDSTTSQILVISFMTTQILHTLLFSLTLNAITTQFSPLSPPITLKVSHKIFMSLKSFNIDRKSQFLCDIQIALMILHIVPSSCTKKPEDARNISRLRNPTIFFLRRQFVFVFPGLAPYSVSRWVLRVAALAIILLNIHHDSANPHESQILSNSQV